MRFGVVALEVASLNRYGREMTPDDITQTLKQQFGDSLKVLPPDAWQVDTNDFRLLVLLSQDGSWLRMLLPMLPAAEAQSFLAQILAANFDATQEVRYALHEGVLWGVFHHDFASLVLAGFESALNQLLAMKQAGIGPFFQDQIEVQIRQIIKAAKQQGQTLESTMKTLDRLYAEGVMGDMASGAVYQSTLAAWQRQLERLWPQVDESSG